MVSKIKTDKYCLYFYSIHNNNKCIGSVISKDNPDWLNNLDCEVKHEGFVSKDSTLCFFAKPLEHSKILDEFRRSKQDSNTKHNL